MIKSMTGYGEFENKNDYAHVYVQIKSLNSRFFDFYSKSCKVLSIYDDEIKNKIKNSCSRGNFQLKTKIEFNNAQKTIINKESIKNYIDIKNQIEILSDNTLKSLSIDKLISMPEIYQVEERDHSLIKDLYFKCADKAIAELNNSRNIEGKNIEHSFNKNLDNLDKGLKVISNLHKETNDNEFDKYKDRINKIIKDLDIDESRLYQEIAIMVDRKDINEEVIRLDSHLSTLRDYLSEDNEIGKKINFMLQEINREINTISSKSSNIKITHETLRMKSEVEQIREQVQNIL